MITRRTFLHAPALLLGTAPTPPRVLVLGDSLAHGAFATGPAAAYPARLAVALGAVDTMLVPAGGRLESAEATWAAYGAEGWDLAVIEIGINDTLSPSLPDDAWAVRYGRLVRVVLATGARVVCATPFDVGQQAEALAGRAALIRANSAGTAVADLWAATQGREALRAPIGAPSFYRGGGEATDDLHPNNAGHARVAEVILAAARPRLALPLISRQSDAPSSA